MRVTPILTVLVATMALVFAGCQSAAPAPAPAPAPTAPAAAKPAPTQPPVAAPTAAAPAAAAPAAAVPAVAAAAPAAGAQTYANMTFCFPQLGAESDWRTANTASMKETAQKLGVKQLIFSDAQQKQENQISAM